MDAQCTERWFERVLIRAYIYAVAAICKVKFTHIFDFLLALKSQIGQDMKSGSNDDGD